MTVKILCIEDNPQQLRLIRKILQGGGFSLIEAVDGLSGVQLASQEKTDLILMDINLPDIDGLEATARIKANPMLAKIPIVALTANAMYGDEERALAAGCDGYMVKPVSRMVLIERVKQFLNLPD